MLKRKSGKIKLVLAIATAMFIITMGTGIFRDQAVSAKETYKGLKLFTDVLELVEKNYVDPVDSQAIIHKAIQGMITSLDPHSMFMPPEAFTELKMDTQGEFGGIGIVITMKKAFITVISPIEGTPAYRAGIKAGDIIIKVDGVSTEDMALWEAVKKMRGPKGTEVIITVARKEEPKPIDFKLLRDIIPIESVKAVSLKPGYGYIWLTNFRGNTTDDLLKAIYKLETEKSPLKGLVLDLRDNPGGLLDQSIKVSDIFLEKGNIVSIKGRLKQHDRVFSATANSVKRDYPLVVLINGGSASASEIVAGALQDNGRALILGTTSFGKGSVQTVETLRDGYGLKYTIARYFTPNGRSIQAQGIVPDIIIKPGRVDDTDQIEEERLLKEKDLKNHLEAGPLAKPLKDPKKSAIEPQTNATPEKKALQRAKSRHVPITVEDIKDDRQVARALELLIGNAILNKR
jgi:carboxyl-terminal processing protease